MGRKSRPIELHELHGTRRPDRHGDPDNDVEAPGEVDAAPDWMTDAQKAGWNFAVQAAPMNVLKRIDRAALAAFVIAEDRFIRATKKLNEIDATSPLPLLAKGQKGEAIVSPYVRISNHAMLIMARMASELGFTPASRPRMNRPDGGDFPADPMRPAGRNRGNDFDSYLAGKPTGLPPQKTN